MKSRYSSAFLSAAASLSLAVPALAWNVEVGVNGSLEDSFYVNFFSGSPVITTLREGRYASTGTGSFDSTYTFQNWNGSAWPSVNFDQNLFVDGVNAAVRMGHTDANDQFVDGPNAFVFGNIALSKAYGASWAYDFQLTLSANSFARLFLDNAEGYGIIESSAGDEGYAFASISLYNPTVSVDAPTGANNPYVSAAMSATSPPTGQSLNQPLGFNYTFTNNTASPVIYSLRLAGSASVLETTVPEPGTAALLLAGLGSMAARRRARSAGRPR